MKTVFILLTACACYGYSDSWINAMADSIYLTEGGSHTKWEYGIKTHYAHTTPRQACLNTINHQVRLWEAKGRYKQFISFLSDSYCPYQCDPVGHERWIKNMRYFMSQKHQPENPE